VPDGVVLEVAPGLSVAWDDLDRARSDLAAEQPSAEWRLEGELGAAHTALRVLTGATGKGSLILLAAARPEGADGHDSESPRAVLVSGSGELRLIDEALLSTQYSANGRVERVGLELYAEGDDYPVRGAGDVRRASSAEDGSLHREQAWLDFRLDGEPGDAIIDVVRA
jgi:hypothetical protein